MRVLFIHQGYFPALAGAEAMVQQVAAALQRRGYEVTIVCKSPTAAFQQYQRDGTTVVGAPTLEPAALHGYLGRLPDIVHLVDVVGLAFVQGAYDLSQAWGVPLVITPASTPAVWEDVPATLRLCRAADAVCVLTEAERALFHQHGVPGHRLVLIGQGPDLAGTPQPELFRRTYGINGSMVLFLGRKAAFKGYKLLLAATAEVWSHYPETCFVFVGPRWDDDCLEVFSVYADPRIIEVGIVDDHEKHSALTACDIFCLPSNADVFPLVYVEAWTCGKPVVATPFPGVAEIVLHGKDGLIVEPSPLALAQGLVRLLGDAALRQQMGRAGQRRMRRWFTWELVADRVELAYRIDTSGQVHTV